MTPVDLRTAPAFEASARLQWRLTISLEPSWDGSDVVDPATAPLWMNLGALPEGLPFISTQDWCRCLDPLALVRSTQHPGEYYVLNSACGVPDDADLWRPMHVNFPDDQHIVWEMDRHRNHDVLQAPYEGDSGFVRWTFERQAYEECAHDILDGLLGCFEQPCSLAKAEPYLSPDSQGYAPATRLLEPYEIWGGHDCEQAPELLRMDRAQIGRKPMRAPGRRIELGFFLTPQGTDHDLLMIDGQAAPLYKLPHAHCAAQAAQDAWLASVRSHYLEQGLAHPLGKHHLSYARLPQVPMAEIHAAGKHYAQVLAQSLLQCGARDFSLRYVPHDLPALVARR